MSLNSDNRVRSGRRDALVVLPPGFVPMTDEDRARAVVALRALFVSYIRDHGLPRQDDPSSSAD